jgi:hypothetical protein
MAIQSATAKLYSVSRVDAFALKVLSTDVFELGSAAATSSFTLILYPLKIMRLFPAMTVSVSMTTAGNISGTYGFEPDPDFNIKLAATSSLNLRTPTTITVDLSKVSFPVSPGQVYTIALSDNFFTEKFNNQMPAPAVTLTTITAPSRPNIYGFSPFNGQSNYDDNTKIVLYADTENVAGALTRGGGFFRLYKNGSLRTSINVLDSKVSISGNKITINVLGLLDAGANYYVLIDNGVVSTLDGFPSLAVTSPTQIAFFTRESSDILFPDLVSLEVAAANLLVPQSEIMIYFASAMTATASMTTAGERVRYVSGTTDTIGGLTTQVSALVVADAVPMTSTSTISIQGTFILANGQANLQSRFSMDFFVLMDPTTISASFAITKADTSVRKPADFRMTSASSLTARGGYRKNTSAALTSTSSFSCSTTAVARATVLYYSNWNTNSVLRLPLYGNVNATVQWGGKRTHRYPLNLLNGYFVPQNTPGSTAFYYADGSYGRPYLGGGFGQTNTYLTPGVKTFTVPSAYSVTYNGQTGFIGPNDFDGYVIIRGQVDYIGALTSEDAQGFDGSLTSEAQGVPYLTEVLAWGDGIKGFRNLGTGNPGNSSFLLNYISPNFPSSMTELREAFGKRLNWNAFRFAPSPSQANPNSFEYQLYLQALEMYNRLPIKNVVEGMNTSGITTMAGCFKNAYLGFQQVTSVGPAPNYQQTYTAYYLNLASWNTSNVTSMKEMFQGARYFIPKGLGSWNTSLVTDFSYMFNNSQFDFVSTNFSSPIDITIDIAGWNTSSATTMKAMFGAEVTPSNLGGGNANASVPSNVRFGSLSGWNTANVTDMSFMFAYYGNQYQTFTQPSSNLLVPTASLGVAGWNTSNVTTMRGMFQSFVGWADDLSSWNTGKVTDFAFMFSIPVLVSGGWMNPNVSSWNTSSATNMMGMFMGATSFNRPLTRSGNIWNTSKVTNMTYMLWSLGNQTELFNQNLSSWCVPLIPSAPAGFDQGRNNTWTLQRPVWGTCP